MSAFESNHEYAACSTSAMKTEARVRGGLWDDGRSTCSASGDERFLPSVSGAAKITMLCFCMSDVARLITALSFATYLKSLGWFASASSGRFELLSEGNSCRRDTRSQASSINSPDPEPYTAARTILVPYQNGDLPS